MVSFINGLSSLGAATAQFAGAAGLETQRAQLAQQQAILADQLATTRETGLQASGAVIAAQAAQKEQDFRTGLEGQRQTFQGTQTDKEIAAKASEGAAGRSAEMARVQAGEAASMARLQAQLSAPSPEIKSAKQFSTLNPDEKQAYREEMMTKAGLPAWMIGGGDNPSPPSGSGSAVPDFSPDIKPDGSVVSPPVTGAPATSGSGTIDTGAPPRNTKALDNIPGPAASIVKGMVDGRISPPSSFALSKPYWQGLINKAAEYDPTFDQTTWAGRVATKKDFASGKSAVAVTALNTALSHAGTLVGDFDTLNNGSLTPLNWAMNTVEPLFGDSRQGKAQETVDALASEARKVFSASGGGNLTELQEWQKNFPLNGSPSQQKAALTGFVELLDGRLQGLADQYNRGMGRTDDPINLLQPKARAVYEKLTGREPTNATGYQMGSPPAAAPPAAATPSVAPVDPTARVIDKSYPLPNGKTGIWRGTGWEIAP